MKKAHDEEWKELHRWVHQQLDEYKCKHRDLCEAAGLGEVFDSVSHLMLPSSAVEPGRRPPSTKEGTYGQKFRIKMSELRQQTKKDKRYLVDALVKAKREREDRIESVVQAIVSQIVPDRTTVDALLTTRDDVKGGGPKLHVFLEPKLRDQQIDDSIVANVRDSLSPEKLCDPGRNDKTTPTHTKLKEHYEKAGITGLDNVYVSVCTLETGVQGDETAGDPGLRFLTQMICQMKSQQFLSV